MVNRSSREKLEEELRELNSKVAKLTSETGEAAIKKLQDEINACKTILKCSICNDHPKEVRYHIDGFKYGFVGMSFPVFYDDLLIYLLMILFTDDFGRL